MQLRCRNHLLRYKIVIPIRIGHLFCARLPAVDAERFFWRQRRGVAAIRQCLVCSKHIPTFGSTFRHPKRPRRRVIMTRSLRSAMLHYLCRFFLLPFKSIDVPLNFSMTHNGKFLNFLLNFLVSLHHIIIFYSLLLAPPCSSSRASSESLKTNVVYTVETGLTCGAFLLASLRAASAAV